MEAEEEKTYWETLKSQYRGVKGIFGRYWHDYGRLKKLITSPYLHISIILTALMFPFWLYKHWWDTALSVLPNVLGFTLAGFTIWLGFGDERFQNIILKRKNKTSPFMGVSAGFAHFIVIQILAILSALWAEATNFSLPESYNLPTYVYLLSPIGHFIGFFLFIYALMTALAATMGVFRTASWYEKIQNTPTPPASGQGQPNPANTDNSGAE